MSEESMTGPEHYQAAGRLLRGVDSQGRTWLDAGWKGIIGESERVMRRQMDLAEAAIHTGLAQAAATAATIGGSSQFGWPLTVGEYAHGGRRD